MNTHEMIGRRKKGNQKYAMICQKSFRIKRIPDFERVGEFTARSVECDDGGIGVVIVVV